MPPSMAEFYIENCIDPGDPQSFDRWLREDVAEGEREARENSSSSSSSSSSNIIPDGVPNPILEECDTVAYMEKCKHLREWVVAHKDLLPISMLLKLLERHRRHLPPVMLEELVRMVELYKANEKWLANNLYDTESEEEKARVRTRRIYEQAESVRLDRGRARTTNQDHRPVRATRNTKNRIVKRKRIKFPSLKRKGPVTSYFTFLKNLHKRRDTRRLER